MTPAIARIVENLKPATVAPCWYCLRPSKDASRYIREDAVIALLEALRADVERRDNDIVAREQAHRDAITAANSLSADQFRSAFAPVKRGFRGELVGALERSR